MTSSTINTNRENGRKLDWSALKNDPEKLRYLYWELKLSTRQIAKKARVSQTSVWKALKQHVIERRTSREGKYTSFGKKIPEILEDSVQLRELYEDQLLSVPQIAKMAGVSNTAVYNALKRYSIKVRSSREGTYARFGKKGVPEILDNPVKLRHLYVELELSARQIAEKAGCSHRAVLDALEQFGIEKRSTSDSLYIRKKSEIPLTDEMQEFLDGSLLGDGHIRPGKRSSYYSLGSEYLEYIEYAKAILTRSGYRVNTYSNRSKNSDKPYYSLNTQSSIELREYRNRWYPDGTRRLPEDLRLTPMKCLYCYLEDGSLSAYKNTVSNIRLCTNNFTKTENVRLIAKLELVLYAKDGIKLSRNWDKRYQKNYYLIRLNKKPAVKFLEYIGWKSPVKCFDYKFDPTIQSPRTVKQKRLSGRQRKKQKKIEKRKALNDFIKQLRSEDQETRK